MDPDVMDFYTGKQLFADSALGNHDYLAGAANYIGTTGQNLSGQIGLSMLSLAILGIMFFYVATRSRQS